MYVYICTYVFYIYCFLSEIIFTGEEGKFPPYVLQLMMRKFCLRVIRAVISQEVSVYLLEDETLAGVGQPATDQLFVNVEAGEGGVVGQAGGGDVDGRLSPALQLISLLSKQH